MARFTRCRCKGNIYLLIGDGGNIAVQTGDQGALVVDTGAGKLADKVVAAIRKLVGDKPIQFIVNTSFRADHTGGNVKVRRRGPIPACWDLSFRVSSPMPDKARRSSRTRTCRTA